LKKIIIVAALPILGACWYGADVDRGHAIAEDLCANCHDLSSAATIKHAPPLWKIVGREPGTAEGFSYSQDFLILVAQKKFIWHEESLDFFLSNPNQFLPDNKMSKFELSTTGTYTTPGTYSPADRKLNNAKLSLLKIGHYELFNGFQSSNERDDLIEFLYTLR
jgi:cytochrome c